MRTIGLLGGMSWESTEVYYRLINQETRLRLGGLHSAPIVMISVDFHEIEQLQHAGDWQTAGALLATKAETLEAAGAELLLICTNTMHKVADVVAAATRIPLLHLADATAVRVRQAGHATVGLLGTRFTMEDGFCSNRLASRGIEVLTPPAADRELVHRVIYDELCQGIVDDGSRVEFLRVIDDLAFAGAEGVIAGCTEIGLLVDDSHTDVALYDTTAIHARAAVAMALE